VHLYVVELGASTRWMASARGMVASCSLLLAALTYACGGGGSDTPTQPTPPPSTPTAPGTPAPPPAVNLAAVRIISGAGQTDTISAILSQPLVVEIRDSTGALAAARPVRFTGFGNLDVAPLGQQNFSFSNTVVTDATGRAQIQVKLGAALGTAYLAVAVAGLGVSANVTFTATRGAPAKFTISPRDTAVSPGGSYTLRVLEITDRGGNPIPGLVPTFSATGVSVTSSGQVTVPSTAPLRAKIVVSYQQASDSAKVSVYPRIPMVIARHDMADNAGTGPGSTVVLINSDGTGSTDVARTTDVSLFPSSVAATPSVVYYRGDLTSNSKVWVVQPNAAPRLLLPGQTRPEAWPRLSPDGTWVYFVRDQKSLWRVKLDGTGLDSLTSFTTSWTYHAPTISPDGRSVAIDDEVGLQIIDVATKAKSILPVTCAHPGYSPDGTYFACTGSRDVSVVRTDGTGRRVLATFGEYDGPDGYSGADWTPDGKWLLVTFRYSYVALVEVSTSTVLPLRGLPNPLFQALFVR
jgi:hypothetical protein